MMKNYSSPAVASFGGNVLCIWFSSFSFSQSKFELVQSSMCYTKAIFGHLIGYIWYELWEVLSDPSTFV